MNKLINIVFRHAYILTWKNFVSKAGKWWAPTQYGRYYAEAGGLG